MMREIARRAVRDTLRLRPVAPYEAEANRVWLIRPDHLGDLLFLRPALKRFRVQLPGWKITLMIGPWSRTIIEDDPNIDELVVFPFPGFTRDASGSPTEPYRLIFSAASQIRHDRPQAVVILRDDHWWGALAARQAGAPTIVGSHHDAMRGLLTDAVEVDGAHSVERNARILDAAATVLGSSSAQPSPTYVTDPLCWTIKDHERESARRILGGSSVSGPYVVIHPGSGAQVKLWAPERWASVATSLERFGIEVVLTGAAAEMPMLDRIAALTSATVHVIGGQTSLGELAAVFESSRAIAGVDSGPLHLAVAVGKPTVHLFGPSNVSNYGPWGSPQIHRVIKADMTCPNCGNLAANRSAGCGCMVAIHEEQVTAAIFDLLKE